MLDFKLRLILAVAILPLGQIAGASTEDQAIDQTVHVVLFAGQSNMAGDGDYQSLDDADKTRVAGAANTVQL